MKNIKCQNLLKWLDNKHPLILLIKEHDQLLAILNRLQDLIFDLKQESSYSDKAKIIILAVNNLINLLIAAEPHHEREEAVIFPELTQRGVSGPPMQLKMQHHELRTYKNAIRYITENTNSNNYLKNLKDLQSNYVMLSSLLEEHIEYENNILYPLAFEFIPDENDWQALKEKCDKIGYCPYLELD